MAKSIINIKFTSTPLEQFDAIVIEAHHPNGTLSIITTFATALGTPRPSGWCLIANDPTQQAILYKEALEADYTGSALVSIKRTGPIVSIESLTSCEAPLTFEIFIIPSTSKIVPFIQNEDCNNLDCTSYEVINDGAPLGTTFEWIDCNGLTQNNFLAIGGRVTICASELDVLQPGYAGLTEVNKGSCSDVVLPPDTWTIVLSEADSNPCTYIKACVTTPALLILLGEDLVANTENPVCVDVLRGQDYTIEGYDADGNFYTQTYSMPVPLLASDISVVWVNGPINSTVSIYHTTGLILMYNIDGGAWQTLNEFTLPFGASYTLNVKDIYGCEIAIPFTIGIEQYNEPKIVDQYRCASLHELNVGKYLNLCGKQHTMKIGFVCNDQPNAIKIFKHIQMVLNTEYAIKNACIKTSLRQERYVPGTHIVYRIRESMHSVPLKNPEDFDDLRGSWAYLELEIESIDNQKVDLFSVIMHLRKSSI
jgi:hypothetical protein